MLRRKPPQYPWPGHNPFIHPPFEATDPQRENMRCLGAILHRHFEADPPHWAVPLAELYREQSRFDEASSVIQALSPDRRDIASRLIASLIARRDPAPVYYRC